jgi:hypothetical protein
MHEAPALRRRCSASWPLGSFSKKQGLGRWIVVAKKFSRPLRDYARRSAIVGWIFVAVKVELSLERFSA